MKRKLIVALPDTHFPFADKKAIKKVHKFCSDNDPDIIIQLGDLTDQKAWSRYTKDTDDLSPETEWEETLSDLHWFHNLFPEIHILSGNHDRRYVVKAVESSIPAQMVRSFKEIFPFKKWTWHLDPKDHLIVDTKRGPILFCHGDEMAGTPIQKAVQLGMNLISGHTHKASITFRQTLNKHIFGAEAGHLLDIHSKAARYSARNPVGSSLGFMVIEDGVPRFVSLD